MSINTKLFKARRLARRYYNNRNGVNGSLPDESDKVVQLYMLYPNNYLKDLLSVARSLIADLQCEFDFVDKRLEQIALAEAKHATYTIRKNEYHEYVARFSICGLRRKECDYHTDDPVDAINTALHICAAFPSLQEETAQSKGQTARLCGQPKSVNPYNESKDPDLYRAWLCGWEAEEQVYRDNQKQCKAMKKKARKVTEKETEAAKSKIDLLPTYIDNLGYILQRAVDSKQRECNGLKVGFFSDVSGEYHAYGWVVIVIAALQAKDYQTALGHLAVQLSMDK